MKNGQKVSSCIASAEAKNKSRSMSQLPTSKNNVTGVEVNAKGSRPSSGATVSGMPNKLR